MNVTRMARDYSRDFAGDHGAIDERPFGGL
jgi:hypothetical protein